MKGQASRDIVQNAAVRIEGAASLVSVPVSTDKPKIPDSIIDKWQTIVDLCADILNVPSGLITKFTNKELEILIASKSDGNPYKQNDSDKLGIGMFCETVAGTKQKMLIRDIDESEYWQNNPHARLGMKSYIGMPIEWEDGELFGTFCFLDNKANNHSEKFIRLLEKFKELIETDLHNLVLKEALEKELHNNELRLREIHHRIKNQFNILSSYIGLQVRAVSDEHVQELLNEIKHRVMVLSLIHEDLYKSDQLNVPGLEAYLPRLCSYIINDFCRNDVKMHVSVENIQMSMENEVSIGLITTELLTNTLKHAFDDTHKEKIVTIQAKRMDDAHVLFVYSDNGKGVEPDLKPEDCESLGMRILTAITAQLHGSMKIENDKGSVFSFCFNV